ncbi:MAG TPA: sugar ABC transporter permease [Chloroflexota bacterium]
MERAASLGPVSARPLWLRLVGAQSVQGGRRALWGYLFIGPWIIGLTVFVAGPILASFYLSLTNYDILSPPRWAGLGNYQRAIFEDPLFWPSLGRSIYYAVGVVPLALVGSLGLAILLNQGLAGTSLFRTFFFMPHLMPAVALGIVWLWLLNPKLGAFNSLLRMVGVGEFPWMTDADTVIPSLILVSLWASAGGSGMVIFLAGLQGVPKELEEAALVDGANIWQRFRHVTLPMITPTIFFNLILGVIGALQVFALAFVATQGGPSYGSWFYTLHIYKQAFDYQRLGYGAALAWLFLALVLLLTLINFAFSRRWVYYRGGS